MSDVNGLKGKSFCGQDVIDIVSNGTTITLGNYVYLLVSNCDC